MKLSQEITCGQWKAITPAHGRPTLQVSVTPEGFLVVFDRTPASTPSTSLLIVFGDTSRAATAVTLPRALAAMGGWDENGRISR